MGGLKRQSKGLIMAQILSYKDCEDLSNTITKSFYYGRNDEFEVWRNKKVPKNENSIMYFYNNQATALICYNILKTKYNCSLVWREYNYTVGKSKKTNWAEDWIVISNNPKKAKQFEK